MIITPHLLIGAAIGAKIRHLGWIIILGIISHFILDKIPHWDYGKKIENIPRNKTYKKIVFINLFKITIDGLMGLIIVLPIILLKNIIKTEHLIFIFFGIFISLLPDFVLGIAKLSYHKSKLSRSYINNLHDKILHHPKHISKPTMLGLGTEILVSLIAILILLL